MKKLLIIIIFLLPFLAFAKEIGYPPLPGAPTITSTTTFPLFVKYIFNFFIILSGFIAFGVIIWGGILYLTSAGDPTEMARAKSKILKAFLGLTILLSSYLLLSIVNPELVIFSLGSAKPTSGIYLIDKDGKKFYFNETKSSIPEKIKDISQVEFISPSSTLSAIYLYSDENFKGEVERVVNFGISPVLNVSEPKSIYFLKNDPGIYLCPEVLDSDDYFDGSYICPQKPYYTASSIKDLTKVHFDNMAQSIIIKNTPEVTFGAILFESTDYVSTSACPYIYQVSIPDLDQEKVFLFDTYNSPPIGKNQLSSLIVFSYPKGKQISGKAVFYDQEACSPGANATTVPFSVPYVGGCFSSDWQGKIKSLEILGTGGVLLSTTPACLGTSFSIGHCKFYSRKDIVTGNCITKLSREIFNPDNDTYRPRSYLLIPYAK